MVVPAEEQKPNPVSPASASSVPRYSMVDGWRGIAALSVLLSHLMPNGVLGNVAVMAFFVISGYCITASARIDSSRERGVRYFLLRRVRRIYPPYLLSILYFVATRVAKLQFTGVDQLDRSFLDYAQNLTLTQWLSLTVHPSPSPIANDSLFVAAYWSLCYEEQFYMVFAAFLLLAGFTRSGFFGPALALFGCSIAWNLLMPDLSYGLFIEYWMIFGVGILVYYRLHVFPAGRAASIAIDCFLWAGGIMRLAWAFDLLEIPLPGPRFVDLGTAALFGLTLVYLRAADQWYASSRMGRSLSMLGLISFSLYLIQECNLTFVAVVTQKLSLGMQLPYLALLIQVVLHIALATMFWYCCERPFLSNRKRRTAASS